jgi:hypothetical protein
VPQWPWVFGEHNPPTISLQTWNILGGGGAADNPQNLGLNQLGIDFNGYFPPDSMGAVGPTQFVMVVNGLIRVFDKITGAMGPLSADLDAFFNSVRNGVGTGDPMVKFDRTSNRWFVTCLTANDGNRILIAVSNGPDITATSSFTFYFFQSDTLPPAFPGSFADYPSLGVDANALYIGTNRFSPNYTGSDGFVVRKSSVTGAGPIVVTCFRSMGGTATSGTYSPRGVDNWDPNATVGYFVGVDTLTYSTLCFRRISNPFGTPSISGNIVLHVPTTVYPIPTNAYGSAAPLDALDDRLFAAQIHRNRATGIDYLWTSHNIEVNTNGVAQSGGGRNGSRWYQIGNLATTPTLIQAGTLFDPSATNPVHHWIPSVAMTGQGHMALGCSVASANLAPGARAAGRLSSDALGTIQAPTTIVTAGGLYNFQGGVQRWGDYSFTSVDPADDQTMWTVQEYCDSTNSWGVRMTKLLAPPPSNPISCNPPIVDQGVRNINITVTGAAANGSAYYDTDATFPNRLGVVVNGGGVTINSISFNPATPNQFVMNVTVAYTATATSRLLTVTNPDGQSVTSDRGVFSINPSVCYANCDGSTVSPILNINDFQCFISAFAAYDPYANCDGSTNDPILNVNDFQCFLNAFSAGCSG